MYARKEAEINWGQTGSNAISPFTNLGVDAKGNTNFNYLGTALLGGGTGLITWALTRLLGLKSGASLTAGILGALATSVYSLGRQKYGDAFDFTNTEQLKKIFTDPIDQKRAEYKQKKAEKQISSANEAAKNSLQQRVEKGTFKNVNPYVPNAPVTTVTQKETEPPPIINIDNNGKVTPVPKPQAPVEEQQVAPTVVPGNDPNKDLANPDPQAKMNAITQAAQSPTATNKGFGLVDVLRVPIDATTDTINFANDLQTYLQRKPEQSSRESRTPGKVVAKPPVNPYEGTNIKLMNQDGSSTVIGGHLYPWLEQTHGTPLLNKIGLANQYEKKGLTKDPRYQAIKWSMNHNSTPLYEMFPPKNR